MQILSRRYSGFRPQYEAILCLQRQMQQVMPERRPIVNHKYISTYV